MKHQCCNPSSDAHPNHHHDDNGEHNLILETNGKNHFEVPLIEKDKVSSLSNEEKKKIFENCVKNMITLMGEDYEREGLVKTPSRVFHSFESLCEGYNVKDPKEILGKALFR
ncbi:predicted protein [Naegleria gruberi]|uniref:GTP cyclohydrolase 1 n=1 Tax=Naegleria gruberi TaxID=5762 RepID=D2VJB8_NAEGR|nr:uncharacterized protein NAEGRDRAFT_68982 [Naegleria gruberi]EFC42918.1 predicted protein [Naegleria gruberi]|eukprot:XP_002675662.1 predicted protein [Naegleria gruberi strain NEG-M]